MYLFIIYLYVSTNFDIYNYRHTLKWNVESCTINKYDNASAVFQPSNLFIFVRLFSYFVVDF